MTGTPTPPKGAPPTATTAESMAAGLVAEGSRVLALADAAREDRRVKDARPLYQEAIRTFEEALRVNPTSPEAMMRRAYARNRLGEASRAEAELRAAVKRLPNQIDAHLAIGQYFEFTESPAAAEREYRAASRVRPPDAGPYLLLARSQLTRGDAGRAAQTAAKAIALAPEWADARILRARALGAKSDFAEGLEEADAAVRLEPESTEALFIRGLMLGEHGLAALNAGDEEGAKSWFQRAIDDFGAALRIDPSLRDPQYRRAAARAQIGLLDEALQDVTDLIRHSPNDIEALSLRASCLVELGRNAEAVADFDQVIDALQGGEPGPELVEALVARGNARWAIGDADGGIADLKSATVRDPKRADLHRSLGVMYELAGRPQEALGSYRRVIQLGDRSADAFRNRADALAALGKSREAEADYDTAIKIDPRLYEARAARGELRWARGDAEGALDDLNRAIKVAGEVPVLYQMRGEILDSLGETRKALADYDLLVKLGGASAVVYDSRANAEASLGKYKQAMRDFDRAIELDPKLVSSYVGRGRVMLLMSPDDRRIVGKALRDFDAAVSLAPDQAAGYAGRADAQAALGHDERSIADYDRALALDPTDTGAHRGRILALLRLGDNCRDRRLWAPMNKYYDEALHAVEQALSIDPNDAYLDYLRGTAFRVLDGFDEAVSAAAVGLAKPGGADPDLRPWLIRDQADSLRLWGEEVHATNKLEDAADVIHAALRDPNGPVEAALHELLGHVFVSLGRYGEALTAFDRAIRAGSDPLAGYDVIWAEIGRCRAYLLKGDAPDARAAGTRALAAAKGRPALEAWARVAVGLALERSGEAQRGTTEMNRALLHGSEGSSLSARAEQFEYFKALDHASADRRRAAELEPDNPEALNALAWFEVELAKVDDLGEAHRLAIRAVKLEADGPLAADYLDTQGWIALKRGRRSEAIRCLRQAVSLRPHDLGIRFHLAEATGSAASKPSRHVSTRQLCRPVARKPRQPMPA